MRVLTRKTLELMTVDHLGELEVSSGVGFGLGLHVVKDLGARGSPGSIGEYAWGGAYQCTYWVDPKRSSWLSTLRS
jgi:CubicO group peptidase (beta-lactamase class C family)